MRFRALWFLSVSVAVLTTAVAGAIAQAPPVPSFEVASVKSNKSGALARRFGMPGDRFEASNVSLQELIEVAFGEAGSGAAPPQALFDAQLIGGPSWRDTDRFDISARVPANSEASTNTPRQKLLMLQALLIDRFSLVVHRETRELPIYALVLARSDGRLGPQLRHSDVDCNAILASLRGGPPPPPQPGRRPPCSMGINPGGALGVSGQTMATIASFFTRLLNRTVRDQTGLSGVFDLEAQFNPESLPGLQPPPGANAPPASDAPSIFTAVQEQLGLKLESTKGPVDVLVIDHVEHPTEN